MAVTSYGDPGFSRFIRKALSRNLGFSSEDLSKPIIGICNTESEVNRCHARISALW
jgi:dihydroxyacid dehydratase/phosphogluconate dehydratase